MSLRPCFLVLCCVLLSACAGLQPTVPARVLHDAANDFALEGRFSLRYEDKNVSGRLSWRHTGGADDVMLSSPFGQGIAEITSDAGGARLNTADGKTFTAPDVITLTRDVLGYPLPLGLLTDWVRGRTGTVGDAARVERDTLGRVQRLQHEGWRVAYDYAGDDAQALPERIVVEQAGGFELRFRVDQWQTP